MNRKTPQEVNSLIELESCLFSLNEMIEHTIDLAKQNDIVVHRLKTPNGELMLAPLIVAKVDCILALIKLKEGN